VLNPTVPTFYFIGVSTAGSSARRIFPRWVELLGRPEVVLQGLDFALHDEPARFRACVTAIRDAPLALGALVTTHKIDLLDAAHDLFDRLTPEAETLHEVSAIGKVDGQLVGSVSDPVSGGASLDALLGDDYFGRTGGEILCLGAGGAAGALLLHVLGRPQTAA
jgi:shikimate 5-dehydrogenase